LVDAVMDDGAVRSGTGDGVEGNVDQRHLYALAGLAPAFFELADRVDLVDAARLAAVEPGEECRDRSAVAPMGVAHAGKLRLVLGRTRQDRRIAQVDRTGAIVAEDARKGGGGRGRVEGDGGAARSQCRDVVLNFG